MIAARLLTWIFILHASLSSIRENKPSCAVCEQHRKEFVRPMAYEGTAVILYRGTPPQRVTSHDALYVDLRPYRFGFNTPNLPMIWMKHRRRREQWTSSKADKRYSAYARFAA